MDPRRRTRSGSLDCRERSQGGAQQRNLEHPRAQREAPRGWREWTSLKSTLAHSSLREFAKRVLVPTHHSFGDLHRLVEVWIVGRDPESLGRFGQKQLIALVHMKRLECSSGKDDPVGVADLSDCGLEHEGPSVAYRCYNLSAGSART